MLDLVQAAEYCGYSVHGMRKVITRSRQKIAGKHVNGPTISFHQTHFGAPIKFRQEWLEEFIETYAHHCTTAVVVQPACRRKKAQQPKQVAKPIIDYNLMQ